MLGVLKQLLSPGSILGAPLLFALAGRDAHWGVNELLFGVEALCLLSAGLVGSRGHV